MDKLGFVIVAVAAIYIISGQALEKNVRTDNSICKGETDNTTLPNDDSCTQYFICVAGKPQPNTCPKGQWFNQTLMGCDSSKNDKCNPSDEFQCPKEGIFFYPHEEFCDRYIMCFAGFPILSYCAEGLYFDRDSLKCDKPEVAECKKEKCPEDDNPLSITFLPSDVDCERYYICYMGIPLEQYCAPGIHWNPVTSQCDFVENVNCTIIKPEEPEFPEPQEIPCDEGIYFETHPNSCEHYFICSFGESIQLSCAPGFHFDNKYNWCDLDEHVECEAKEKKVANYSNEMVFDSLSK